MTLTLQDVATKEPRVKLETFVEVCRQFQPVFRHFFLERWLEPADWYERRTAYTRSVATNSIGELRSKIEDIGACRYAIKYIK